MGVGVMGLRRTPGAFVNLVFAAGMILFALSAGFVGLAWEASGPEGFLFWTRWRFAAASLIPGLFLLFSISFARSNYREQINRWKWVLVLSFAVPVSLTVFFREAFFLSHEAVPQGPVPFFHTGWSGYYWHLAWLVFSILILMNLERTFRHTTGHMRWQTKFMFLGIACIFGIQIYTDSQTVIFRGLNTALDVVDLGALLLGSALILKSLFRGKPLEVTVYLSHQFLYSSLTMLIVGAYFITVGAAAWISLRFEWIRNVHVVIFLIFTAVIGIVVFQLSDRLRIRRKRFVSRHFKRPQYDYQKIWEGFTSRTASVTQTRDLCDTIVRMISDTLEILSVTIWLKDEKEERLSFGGSTVLTARQVEGVKLFGQGGADLIRAMTGQAMPVDLEGRDDDWAADVRQVYGFLETRESRTRYCAPLNAGGRLIGIMTLGEKVLYEPLSFEELELVRTIGDQAAASILNLQLSERLRQAREMEAFQSMSAFFLHDLKNLASKLSLVTQNLPVHLDNPEFRADALKTISQCVVKINAMSGRLSLLSEKPEPAFKKTDLNRLIEEAVSGVREFVRGRVSLNLGKIPQLWIDPEQIHNVLENLLMNAADALGPDGEIMVASETEGNWAIVSVQDNGCGMSSEFMEKSLFRPFRTTKKKGMGIGLYHCRTLVEAHGGRIEAESREGEGTTVRIKLAIGNRQ